MSHTALSHSELLNTRKVSKIGPVVAIALAAWLAVVWVLGARETLVTPRGTPPLALLIAVLSPILVFLAGYGASGALREFVLSADLRLITGMQAWRFGGFVFLALHTYGVLPGYFAWPAGLGDMAIGVTALWMLAGLSRQPGFAASKAFVVWNLLGILDLIVAVGSGTLGPLLDTAFTRGTGTAAMAHLPLVLIPAYFVPGFVILHLTALFQARRFLGHSS
jgi:hypothetical protein